MRGRCDKAISQPLEPLASVYSQIKSGLYSTVTVLLLSLYCFTRKVTVHFSSTVTFVKELEVKQLHWGFTSLAFISPLKVYFN